MYQTILVPLDGSPLAERALPTAAMLAAGGSRVLLLSAEPEVGSHGTDDGGYPRDLESTAAMHYLRTQALLLAAAEGMQHVEPVAVEGEAAPAILKATAERQVDVIVMATHGRGGLARWLYGSVADAVLRHAITPVVLVPVLGDGRRGAIVHHQRRILLPLDGSELAQDAVPAASDLARAMDAEIVLLTVVEPSTNAHAKGYAYTDDDPSGALIEARRYLDGIAATLRGRGHRVTVCAEACEAAGQATETITAVATEHQVDVIVMATHGRGGLARFLMGSVATGVLRRTVAPLLLVRPAALRAASPAPVISLAER